MKSLVTGLTFFLVIVFLVFYYAGPKRSAPVKPAFEQKYADPAATFRNGDSQEWIDRFGTVSRAAFDALGKRIATQVGHVGDPNGIAVEVTYVVPNTDHPFRAGV